MLFTEANAELFSLSDGSRTLCLVCCYISFSFQRKPGNNVVITVTKFSSKCCAPSISLRFMNWYITIVVDVQHGTENNRHSL